MIDFYCHLACSDFTTDLDAVISRGQKGGIERMITIMDSFDDMEETIRIAEKYEHIFCSIGVHPHYAQKFDVTKDLDRIRTAAAHHKCRAIGEIGLDYHYMHSPRDVQMSVFAAQLLLAKELNLPAVIHCREAVQDLRVIVERVQPRMLVIHCCTERWEDISWCVHAGYLLSFTGIVTYPKATTVHETVAHCPLSQMMVETDAPFLAPVPHRGKRCEPLHVLETARAIAKMKGVSFEEVERATSENAIRFYGI